MIQYILSFFKKNHKENLYKEKHVKYIIRELLRQTVDRNILKKTLKEKFSNNPHYVVEILEIINELEILEDEKKINYWLHKLREMNNNPFI